MHLKMYQIDALKYGIFKFYVTVSSMLPTPDLHQLPKVERI